MKNNGLPMWWMGESLLTFSEDTILEGEPDSNPWESTDSWWFIHTDEEGKLKMTVLPVDPVGYPYHESSDGWTTLVANKEGAGKSNRWFARLWRKFFGHPTDMKLYIDGRLWKGKWHERASRLFRFITRRYPDETSWRGT